MKIERLQLVNFRNFEKTQIVFHPETTIFVGNNGQGKTNLLESIYFLATSRSFRLKHDGELIKHGAEMTRVTGVFEHNRVHKTITSIVHDQGKTILLNKQPVSSIKSMVGEVPVVLFSPLDMFFFDDSPRTRRRFLDIEGSKCDQVYVEALYQYNKILKERNLYLKQDNIDFSYLDTLDSQLVEVAVLIINFRERLIQFLNQKTKTLYEKLAKENQDIEIQYQAMIDLEQSNRKEAVLESIKNTRERDLLYKVTNTGVHRDDLIVYFNEKPVENVASQGQKRLLIIAIKLALLEFIEKTTNKTPILLLDDVFSEIDEGKKRNFITVLPKNIQTIITTTSLDEISTLQSNAMTVYTIKDGSALKGV
ncbi:MAG: DNA replication/repair protein RecF [Erysipelothrix sp.]|nr:DNA replication/repair protein RecF [Erysipelothrix sp.]